MYIPVGGIYVYERVSEMKGFAYKNVSREEESCGGEKLNRNSSLWRLEEEVRRTFRHLHFYRCSSMYAAQALAWFGAIS